MRSAIYNFRSVVFIAIWLSPFFCFSETTTNSPGLVCTASDGRRKITFVVPTPNFTLQNGQSIHPQIGQYFDAKWDGFLKINRAGKYIIGGGAARILVHGQEMSGREIVALDAGDLPLSIEFQHFNAGGASLQLSWQSEFFKREPIPWTAFAHSENPPELLRTEKIARGRDLAEEFNCFGCHKTESTIFQPRRGPDLTGIGSRVNVPWIFKWLAKPRHYRSDARMPVLLKTPQLRADVTAFLASLKTDEPLKPVSVDTNFAAGEKLFQNIGCAACHDEKSLAGVGSKMPIAPLAGYLRDPLKIDPSGRMPDFALTARESAQLATFLAQSKNANFEDTLPTGDAQRGKQFFGIIGCVNCHTLETDGEKISARFTASPFEQLQAHTGCLAESPSQFAPVYNFTADEREALNEFVESPDISKAPIQDFHRLTKKFHCASCHELYGAAKLTFSPNQSPPPLTDGGNKLRRSWLEKVFVEKKRVRPWLPLHMPHFGAENVTNLIDGFAAQAGAELGEGEKLREIEVALVEDGIHFIGRDNGGFSCISCHDYRGQKSDGEMRGPDLIEMYDRCRADWLTRWLRDPGRIIPGTAMPEYFSGGPEGQTEAEIQHIIHALATGKKMPVPAGLNEDAREYLLLATNEPIVLRCFLPDASPRAITVGFPGQINCCFDAATSRFCYAWAGDFLDMKPVWSWRGGKPPQILGQKFYIAPDCFPLRIGDRAREPKVKFLGYELVKKNPEFLYEVDGALVRERISASTQGKGVIRSFDLGQLKQDIWFNGGTNVIVSGNPAPVLSDGWWKISGGNSVQFQVAISARNSSP